MTPKPRALLPLLLVSLALPAFAQDPAPPPDPERVRWVAEHALAVRSIEPADEDFTDLMPLVQVIGKARVVQLGEATHGDGATFLAKGRLVRFLHQVMGFDVMAWESGFFDLRRLDEALRGGLPSAEAAGRGLYPAWRNQESMATLDYVSASQKTDRPILSVGFDCRVSGQANRAEFFPRMIFGFFDRLDPALLSKDDRERFTALSLAVNTLPNERYWKPEIRQYLDIPRRLIETIDRRRAELLVHDSPREIDYVRQSLVSLLATEHAILPGGMTLSPDGYRRDQAMAENLLWWLNGPLKDRKVIVWAHNYHVMSSNYLAKDDAFVAKQAPMGQFLKKELGADLYTIGFTSFGGSYADPDAGGDQPVKPRPLETLLHAAGRPLLFLASPTCPRTTGSAHPGRPTSTCTSRWSPSGAGSTTACSSSTFRSRRRRYQSRGNPRRSADSHRRPRGPGASRCFTP